MNLKNVVNSLVDIYNLPDDVIPRFAEIIKRSIIGIDKYLDLGYENFNNILGNSNQNLAISRIYFQA